MAQSLSRGTRLKRLRIVAAEHLDDVAAGVEAWAAPPPDLLWCSKMRHRWPFIRA
jgi:hypothetical protein